jgi:hypothetical protein
VAGLERDVRCSIDNRSRQYPQHEPRLPARRDQCYRCLLQFATQLGERPTTLQKTTHGSRWIVRRQYGDIGLSRRLV